MLDLQIWNLIITFSGVSRERVLLAKPDQDYHTITYIKINK